MLSTFRRIAAAAVAVVALGAGGAAWAASSASASATSASATSASAAPSATGKCTYNNLATWVYADGADTTAGTVTYHLELTNIGRSTCSLTGFPVVTATTLGRVVLGARAADLYGVPAKTIDLAAGATAHSVIQYIGSRVVASCKPERAGFLAVYPPSSGAAKRAFFPLSVCTTGRVDLTVRRVQAGL